MWPFRKRKNKCDHQWSKWSNPKDVEVTSPDDPFIGLNGLTYTITMQSRYCELCNEYHERQL